MCFKALRLVQDVEGVVNIRDGLGRWGIKRWGGDGWWLWGWCGAGEEERGRGIGVGGWNGEDKGCTGIGV